MRFASFTKYRCLLYSDTMLLLYQLGDDLYKLKAFYQLPYTTMYITLSAVYVNMIECILFKPKTHCMTFDPL